MRLTRSHQAILLQWGIRCRCDKMAHQSAGPTLAVGAKPWPAHSPVHVKNTGDSVNAVRTTVKSPLNHMNASLKVFVLVAALATNTYAQRGVWFQADSQNSATPVALTGWDADVIGKVFPPVPTSPGFDGGGYVWFPFPQSGRFTSAYNTNVEFQLQPFTQANVLLLSSAMKPQAGSPYASLPERPAGTLLLVQPARFSFLAVAASSGGGGGIGKIVLNFADGTSSREFPLMAPDWWNYDHAGYWTDPEPPGHAAILGLARVSADGGVDAGTYNGKGEGFALYESDLDLSAEGLSSKVLFSITFTKRPAVDPKTGRGPWTTGIFAVSGVLNEPSITASLEGDGAGVKITVRGPTNMVIRLEVSGDLKSWKPLAAATNSGGTFQFSDSEAHAGVGRFYRASRSQ